jgi:hypothetical protein
MKTFKKIIRYVCFVLLIFLASLGIGIVGGVPITPIQRRNEMAEIHTELAELKDGEEDLTQLKQKE